MPVPTARILVVEDDPSIRVLITVLLQTEGHEIHEIDRGDEAIDAIRRLSPDLVLLDIGLPGMTGLEVLAEMREDEELRETAVLVVSAWAEDAVVRRALDLGVLGYIRKPFAVEELGELVEATLREVAST